MTPAIIADDLKTLRRILAQRGFLGTAFWAALRLHHVTLIKDFLIFFAKDKNIFALNTRDLDIRHMHLRLRLLYVYDGDFITTLGQRLNSEMWFLIVWPSVSRL